MLSHSALGRAVTWTGLSPHFRLGLISLNRVAENIHIDMYAFFALYRVYYIFIRYS